MANKLRNPKEKIIAYFDTCGDDYWKTVTEISAGTNIEPGIVGKTVTNSTDFVRAHKRNEAGELLYTSRKRSREEKLITK